MRPDTHIIAVLLLIVALATSGCSTTSNSVSLKGEQGVVERKITIDPVVFAGIPLTHDIVSGNFEAYLAAYPDTDEALAEYDPFRVSYPCYAVDASGRKYTAHALFAGYVGMRVSAIVIVEGLQTSRDDVRIVWLSTRIKKAFSLSGSEITVFDADQFRKSSEYRQAFVSTHGTPVTSLAKVRDMDRAIKSWTVYDTKVGQIASPLSIEQVRMLAGKNPMYSYKEKLIGTGRGSITITFDPAKDLVMNAARLALDLAVAAGAKPMGFDYESKVSRKDFGYMTRVWKGLMEQNALRLNKHKNGG